MGDGECDLDGAHCSRHDGEDEVGLVVEEGRDVGRGRDPSVDLVAEAEVCVRREDAVVATATATATPVLGPGSGAVLGAIWGVVSGLAGEDFAPEPDEIGEVFLELDVVGVAGWWVDVETVGAAPAARCAVRGTVGA